MEQSRVPYGAAAQQQGALFKVGFDRAKQRSGRWRKLRMVVSSTARQGFACKPREGVGSDASSSPAKSRIECMS